MHGELTDRLGDERGAAPPARTGEKARWDEPEDGQSARWSGRVVRGRAWDAEQSIERRDQSQPAQERLRLVAALADFAAYRAALDADIHRDVPCLGAHAPTNCWVFGAGAMHARLGQQGGRGQTGAFGGCSGARSLPRRL